jgi:hypothetical protein
MLSRLSNASPNPEARPQPDQIDSEVDLGDEGEAYERKPNAYYHE